MSSSQSFKVSKNDLDTFLNKLGVRKGRERDRALHAVMVHIVAALMEELSWEFDRRSEGYSGKFTSAWRPLLPSTVARKRREGWSKPEAINFRSGRLRQAFEPGTVSNNRYYSRGDQVVTISENSATIAVNVPYLDQVQAKRPIWSRTAFKAIAAVAVKKGLRAYIASLR